LDGCLQVCRVYCLATLCESQLQSFDHAALDLGTSEADEPYVGIHAGNVE
jgi:hypothetical protein